jgi:hypothetical protein
MSRAFFALALFFAACGSPSNPPPPTVDAASSGVDAASSGDLAQAQSNDTWGNYAQNFFATYCVGCHGPGNPNRDYSQYSQVQRDLAKIICGVGPVVEPGCDGTIVPDQFPIGNGPKPSTMERTRLVAWINAGAPQ